MTSSKQLTDKYIWRAPHRANHWWCWELTFCNYSHKYNLFLVFQKDMSQGSIHPKLTKTSKRHDRHCCGTPVVKQTFVCRVPLIFKNVRRRKKRFIINVNLKKYPRQIQYNVTDLKVELLVKIGKNCEL